MTILPDLSALQEATAPTAAAEQKDELQQALTMALATLEPILCAGASQRARRRKGVLAHALRAFTHRGGGDVDALVGLLSELPEDASDIREAQGVAYDMADDLRAAIAVNPLLQAGGRVRDVGELFAGRNGRTRISVINLAGLASEAAREAFVNQLQMSLFTWIKQHPSQTPRLYALDEAQNYAPAQRGTACKASAMALAAQGRKYGLGMIFATQLPKGIDNGIVSNCLTHVYGKMNAPATIQAVQELMAAKGGGGEDIGRLTSGEFYFSTENMKKSVKIRTALCLSHHPAAPPTAEEIVRMARRAFADAD